MKSQIQWFLNSILQWSVLFYFENGGGRNFEAKKVRL
jgi:hypothetical protein